MNQQLEQRGSSERSSFKPDRRSSRYDPAALAGGQLASVGEVAAASLTNSHNPGHRHLRIESVLSKMAADDPRRKSWQIVDQKSSG